MNADQLELLARIGYLPALLRDPSLVEWLKSTHMSGGGPDDFRFQVAGSKLTGSWGDVEVSISLPRLHSWLLSQSVQLHLFREAA
ncbi:MAG: hypothetical protein INR66_14945 [Gordonia polyisoprenivorans]|nr:hypothetical protein [Gordonia polyisoprenivorans]